MVTITTLENQSTQDYPNKPEVWQLPSQSSILALSLNPGNFNNSIGILELIEWASYITKMG